MEPLLSVVTITYNHGPYIAQCIESVLAQRTDFPIEFIIADDCSTDRTKDICIEYARKYPEIIRMISSPTNAGAVMNEQRAFIAAKGKYIATCEGDDYWIRPDKLRKQIDFMDKNMDYSLCGTNGLILYDNGAGCPIYFNRIFESRDLLPNDIIGKWPFPTASIVIRANVRDNWPEWTSKIYSGDQTLILIALSKGRVYGLGELCVVYRKNENPYSASVMASKESKAYVPENHKILYTYFNEHTNGRFATEIKPVINSLEHIIKFYRLQEKSLLMSWIRYPKTSFILFLKSKKAPLLQKLNSGKSIL